MLKEAQILISATNLLNKATMDAAEPRTNLGNGKIDQCANF